MPTPVEFMRQYRNLKVNVVIDDPVARVCRTARTWSSSGSTS